MKINAVFFTDSDLYRHGALYRRRLVQILLGLSLLLTGCGLQSAAADLPSAAATQTDILQTATSTDAARPTIAAAPTLQETPALPARTISSTATAPAALTPTPRTPVATASPTALACWKKSGQTITGSLKTKYLRLPLDYRIHLPPCYDIEDERRYPVLYLIHGQSYTDDQWDRLGADETTDALAAKGELPPFIIVMPRDRTGDQPPEDGFARAVVEVLLPYVDENYRTLADRQHRAVGGLSRGAGWSVHLGLVYWELFGAMGAHSPAIFYEDARLMRVYLDRIPPGSHPRIFVDVGDKDQAEIYDAALWFGQVLNEKDVPHSWYLFPGYHEEAYWRAHVEKYLRWYAEQW